MSALPIRRDYDGTWKIEGYEELSFSVECIEWLDEFERRISAREVGK